MVEYLRTIFYSIENILKTVKFTDIIDILCVSYLVYKAIQLIRETRAVQLLKGILVLTLFYLISSQLGLKTMSFFLVNLFQIGIVAILIVFQPELRRALEQVGRTKISSKFNVFGSSSGGIGTIQQEELINTLCTSAVSLAKKKIGALIVIERQTRLGDIIKTGTIIDAQVSTELIGNVFFPNSPLHDGAVIIRGNRLYAAGCFLPLMQKMENIREEYGTRHRAAIGMSENSDSVVLVVSEETGVISVAVKGQLTRDLDQESLRLALERQLISVKQPDENKKRKKGAKSEVKTVQEPFVEDEKKDNEDNGQQQEQ